MIERLVGLPSQETRNLDSMKPSWDLKIEELMYIVLGIPWYISNIVLGIPWYISGRYVKTSSNRSRKGTVSIANYKVLHDESYYN